MNAAPERRRAADARRPDAAVLSKAAVRAARLLDLSQRDVSAALGISEATASRLFAGKYLLSPERAKEWELARLLVRMFRSLDALWGHEETARTWLASDNLALGARAQGSAALRRGSGPCRHVPGRRARSPLRRAPLRHDLWRAVEAQHVVVDDARSSTRSTSSMCWSGCSTTASRRFPPAPRNCTTCCSRRFAMRRRRAARAFAGPTTPACSTAPTRSAPPARSSATGAGGTCCDSPALQAMPTKPQTVFRVKLATRAVDLREPPFVRDRGTWTHRDDYAACQRFGVTAREAAHRRDPLRVGARSAARRLLRRAVAAGVRAAVAARAADVDAVGVARARRLAAHAVRRARGDIRIPGGDLERRRQTTAHRR